uniref:Uncharacterized protein n=1 Tax=Arundo donax TaxID=35708 RepID=A0A0A9F7Z2_ARUDO
MNSLSGQILPYLDSQSPAEHCKLFRKMILTISFQYNAL